MFHFKQFTIQQDRTAMKVCTDACVLGAYANRVAHSDAVGRILDIGTGTGLLALMAAQRNPTALVDAVEVDEAAAKQATENVANSRFKQRVRITQGRIQDYAHGQSASQYDCILTNPPFYTNHLRSPDAAVNRALHTNELPAEELLAAVVRLLKPAGQWWVLLPPNEMGKLIQLAHSSGLKPFQRLSLQHQADKPAFRIVVGFSYKATHVAEETLMVFEADGRTYTSAFQALLYDFYLIF